MYISTKEFAEAAGLDRRSAARICKEAFESNKEWFGCKLDVKVEAGIRGGRAGKRYLVSKASLPDLFRNMPEPEPTGEPRRGRSPELLKPASRLEHARTVARQDRRSRVIMERYTAIRHALGARPGSEERHVRIAAAAVQARTSEATIYRWLNLYAEKGLAGLAPKARQQLSSTMVVSRKFDRQFVDQNPNGEEKLRLVGEELSLMIKTMWTTRGSMAGMYSMSQDLGVLLESHCRTAGYNVDGIDCTPSILKIREFRDFSLVHTFLHHAEKRENILPRIRRTYVDVAPMDIVFLDVKRCDIFIESGKKKFRPALIGFLDAGTGRLFAHMVKLPKGKAVTKDQVVGALLSLITHPNWGVPRAIYTDNGSEMFGLIDAVGRLDGIGHSCPIIRAQDYNPQAKPIEGLFGNLNKRVFSKIDGFTGGKRKKLRRSPAQKPAEPYSRTWKEFCNELGILLADYHAFRRRRGPSPDELFQQKLASMEEPLRVLSYEDAASLLGDLTSRIVRQGSFMFGGLRYTDPVLYPRDGQRVEFVVPPDRGESVCMNSGADNVVWTDAECDEEIAADGGQIHAAAPLLLDHSGQLYPARLDDAHGPLDHAGALDSHQRKEDTWKVIERMLHEVQGCTLPAPMALAAARNYKRQREGAPPLSGGISAHGRIDPEKARTLRRAKARERLDRFLSESGDS